MVSFDDVYRLLVETIFPSDTSTDLGMGPFDIMIHRFSEIVKHTTLEGKDRISSYKLRDSFSDIGNFL